MLRVILLVLLLAITAGLLLSSVGDYLQVMGY